MTSLLIPPHAPVPDDSTLTTYTIRYKPSPSHSMMVQTGFISPEQAEAQFDSIREFYPNGDGKIVKITYTKVGESVVREICGYQPGNVK